mgnify:CR=1 FL=1
MPQRLRIVSIGAHPADIFDQSGGTMVHHSKRGDYVACVVLTHGARVHDAVISDAMFHREEVPDQSELLKKINIWSIFQEFIIISFDFGTALYPRKAHQCNKNAGRKWQMNFITTFPNKIF